MGSKNHGHYCIGCGDYLPNEKFSGKGHRKHLCKDCNRMGINVSSESTSDYDRKFHLLNKSIKNCMIVFLEDANFFFFEYQKLRYMISADFVSDLFVYQGNREEKFVAPSSLQKDEILIDVLYKKYYETLESGHVLDYEEMMDEENLKISKKRRQHLEVILSIQYLMCSGEERK